MIVSDKKFYEVRVVFNKVTTERLEELNFQAMDEYHCDGVQEFSIDEPTVDKILGERAYSGGDIPESVIDEVDDVASDEYLSLVYYFYESEDIEKNAKAFKDFVEGKEITTLVELSERPWDDWNQEWRKHYSEIDVHDELVVIPEWEKENSTRKDSECVFIYPGMGFGTGEHQTTYLCLKLFMDILSDLKSSDSCLDFGCGSGILGIAAIKKLNLPTVFCDIDPLALNNCLQNLELNFEGKDLTGTSLVSRAKFQGETKHKLVFANILENVLLLEKSVLLDSLEDGGYLIISGLLNHQVEGIVNEYSELEKISVLTKDDWSAVLLRKL